MELANGPKTGITWSQGGIYTTRAYLASHPNEVAGVLKAIKAAWSDLGSASADRSKLVDAIGAASKLEPDTAVVLNDYMRPVWTAKPCRSATRSALATGIELQSQAVEKGIKPENIIDNGPLEALR